MSWEGVTKDQVAGISGIASSALQDWWYDAAVDTVGRIGGVYNIGNPTAVVEYRDGDGTRRIFVAKPPIQSVTELIIDDVAVSSSAYRYDVSAIAIIDTYGSNPYTSGTTFPVGTKNVKITYVSGTSTPEYSYSLVIALIIKELANLSTQEGADALLQFYRPGKSEATEDPLIRWGVHGKIRGIIDSLIGPKFRVR